MVERRTFSVSDMSCGGREETVENAFRPIDGVHRVEADNDAGTLEIAVDDDIDDDTIGTAVHDAGYEIVD